VISNYTTESLRLRVGFDTVDNNGIKSYLPAAFLPSPKLWTKLIIEFD
jgi:hypothetical protein